LLAVCALFLALAGSVLAGGPSSDILLAAPLFLLAVPLLGGHYWGERHLHRLRTAYAARRRRPTAGPELLRVPRGPHAVLGRGGRAVAGAFFCRPPPAQSVAAR
jgi:hypothetical protein